MRLNRIRSWRGLRVAVAVFLVGSVLFVGGVSPSNAANRSQAGSAVLMAGLFPLTGSVSFVGSALLHGTNVGMYEVNHNGGIMGRRLTSEVQDDAGDAVDAVPAWHALALKNPAFMLGPTVLTSAAVIKLFDPSHMVDFLVAGAPIYDHLQYKYVWRAVPGDTSLAKGMAAYAIHLHKTHGAMLFTNGFNSQTIVPPVTAAFKRHGGQVVANTSIVPSQTSYRTEVEQTFAKHPNVVFWQSDAQTAGTLFHNMEELGDLNVPVVGTDNAADITIAKAMGLKYASKYLSGMAGAAPSGPAWHHYTQAYNKVYHTAQPLDLSDAMYDSVLIAALAMTAAHSTDPKVWVNDIKTVSNPPGTKCYSYAGCLRLLRSGKKIDFEGSSGPMDFNQYHNVFGAYDVVRFSAQGKLQTLYHEPASMIAKF